MSQDRYSLPGPEHPKVVRKQSTVSYPKRHMALSMGPLHLGQTPDSTCVEVEGWSGEASCLQFLTLSLEGSVT